MQGNAIVEQVEANGEIVQGREKICHIKGTSFVGDFMLY